MCRNGLSEFPLSLFICLFVVFSVKSEIHRDMSFDEINQFFGRSDGLVPKYELVDFRLSHFRQKRSDERPNLSLEKKLHFEMRIFGNDIDLWLHPNNDVLVDDHLPILHGSYSETEPGKVKYTPIYNLMEKIGKFYMDQNTSTSLVIGIDEYHKYNINGILGSHNIVIKTLPQHIVDNHTRRRRSIDKSYEPGNVYNHIAFKNDEMTVRTEKTLPKLARFRKSVENNELPNVLYPEILVIVDSSAYKYCGNDNDTIDYLTYLLAFWNGVDLKFRSLINPSIRLHLSAIVFSDSAQATPYIHENMLSNVKFDSAEALRKAWSYFYSVKSTFPIGSYDIIASMTKLQLISEESRAVPDEGTSLMRSTCRSSDKAKEVYSVIIFNDNGYFSGIQNAAHELGHSIGSLDEIGIPKCRNSDGYIMSSPSVFTENSSDFSKCTRIIFNLYFVRNNLQCLYNEPHGQRLPKFMPGKIRDLKAQCKAIGYGDPCLIDSSICVRLQCLNNEGNCKKTRLAALDGTKCDEQSNKFCLKSQCVRL